MENCIAEVDSIEAEEWTEITKTFYDATIYQTWSYGAIRWGTTNLSHLVLRQNGKVIGAAQVRIVSVPLVKRGIAYVTWGPLWHSAWDRADLETLRQLVQALKQEYVDRRSLFLRISPNEFRAEASFFRSMFEAEGFIGKPIAYQTLHLDLSPPLHKLRSGLNQKWRNCLNRSERNDLTLVKGCDDELFRKFIEIYHSMVTRKQFAPRVDVEEYRKLHHDLPEDMKMIVMICEFQREPIAGLVGSMLGGLGIYVLGATARTGLKLKGSYLLQWEMIKWLKSNGAVLYDLGGIDPVGNPGVYHFKVGIGGKVVSHVGNFESCNSLTSDLLVQIADGMLPAFSRLKSFILQKRSTHKGI